MDEGRLCVRKTHVQALCKRKSRKEDMEMRQEGGKKGNEAGRGEARGLRWRKEGKQVGRMVDK